jgi:predicted nucleic acid-binding protein
MTALTFVDTNVLVYARDASEPEKQPVAGEQLRRLWVDRRGRVSFQVLHEYYVTVTRKLSPGLSPASARRDVTSLLAWEPVAPSAMILQRAWDNQDRFQLSFWDAMIVASAQHAGCQVLLTEDLHDGLDLDGLRVVNPFRRSA